MRQELKNAIDSNLELFDFHSVVQPSDASQRNQNSYAPPSTKGKTNTAIQPSFYMLNNDLVCNLKSKQPSLKKAHIYMTNLRQFYTTAECTLPNNYFKNRTKRRWQFKILSTTSPWKVPFFPCLCGIPWKCCFTIFRLSSGPFGGWLGASMKVWRTVCTWRAHTCFRWCQQCLRCVPLCSWAPATFMFAFLKYTFVCLSLCFLIWSLMICSPVASAGWVLEDVDAVEDLFLFSTAALMTAFDSLLFSVDTFFPPPFSPAKCCRNSARECLFS